MCTFSVHTFSLTPWPWPIGFIKSFSQLLILFKGEISPAILACKPLPHPKHLFCTGFLSRLSAVCPLHKFIVPRWNKDLILLVDVIFLGGSLAGGGGKGGEGKKTCADGKSAGRMELGPVEGWKSSCEDWRAALRVEGQLSIKEGQLG